MKLMERVGISPRDGWEKEVASLGLVYNTTPSGVPYWNEGAYYSFSMNEVDRVDDVTNELHAMCLGAVDYVIKNDLFHYFDLPDSVIPLIKESWNREKKGHGLSLYGRFDLAYDGKNIKLLEYNADTPTALLEASIIQWCWKEELFGNKYDQFNSIHEKLATRWRKISGHMRLEERIYFAFSGAEKSGEDFITVTYLRDTAEEAGIKTAGIQMEDIGYDNDANEFVDLDNQRINSIFKLYPWEWIIREKDGPHVIQSYFDMKWIEPIWKMLLSNKALLVVLSEMFPGHELLLEARFSQGTMKNYVVKPRLSREGNNIEIVIGGKLKQKTGGDYTDPKPVFQEFFPIPNYDGKLPVIGSWIVGGEAAGIGIRETDKSITDNTSQFVPHVIIR